MAGKIPADAESQTTYLKPEPRTEKGEDKTTLFGLEQSIVNLARIDYYWQKKHKKPLTEFIEKDADAVRNIDYKGMQDFKEHLRDAFRAAGRRGSDTYAKAVYQILAECNSKFSVEATITTYAIPNDPGLKPGDYGIFVLIAKNGDKLEIPF